MKRIASIVMLLLAAVVVAQQQPTTRTVDTLDEALAMWPGAIGFGTNSVTIAVRGRHTSGDWGDLRLGQFIKTSAATTNLGNTFKLVTNGWTAYQISNKWDRLIFRDKDDYEQDLRWWGGLLDDSTDDTTPLQAMSDAGIPAIRIAAGRADIIGDGVTWRNPVTIVGSQRGRSSIYYRGTNFAFTFTGPATNKQSIGTKVSELIFQGLTDSGSAPAGLIRVRGGTRATFDRLSLTSDRDLGYPLAGMRGILFDEQAWIWSMRDCQVGYMDVGVDMQATNNTGSIVSATEITGGEIFANKIGILVGSTNSASLIGGGRLKANLWINSTTIEANGAYGVWLNGAEQVTISDIYTEANGHLYQTNGAKYFTNEMRSADIVIGNDLDVSTNFSCASIAIRGVRFADSTNGIVVKSGKNIDIANNIWVGNRGVDMVFSPNARNVTVWENNTSSSQSSGYPSVTDTGSVAAYRRQSANGTTGIPIVSQTALQRFGDFDLSDAYWTDERAFYMQPPVAVQTVVSNNSVGFEAVNWGRTGYPRSALRMDGTNVTILSKTETGNMPIVFDINGTEQARIETLTARFRGNMTVHQMDQVENLTVNGSIVAGTTPLYTGSLSGAPDIRMALVSSNNTTETLGYLLYSRDGTYNPSAIIKLVPTVGSRELSIGMNYSSGGNIPVRIRSPVKGILAEFWDPSTNWTSLRLNLNGALEEVRWDPISKALYAGVTAPPVSLNTHTHAASDVVSGTFVGERLGSNTPSTNTVLWGGGAGAAPRWSTIPSTPSPTNGISDAPADSTFYGRFNNAWTTPGISDVSGLQTALDDIDTALGDRQTYDSMLDDGVTAGWLTSTAGLTVYTVSDESPSVNLWPMVWNSSGFTVDRMDTNDFRTQIGAAAATHSHAISDVTGLQTALDGKQPTMTVSNWVAGSGLSSSDAGGVRTFTSTAAASPLVLASGAPVTITLTNETSLISLRSGESKTLSAGYLTTGSVLKLEAEGDMTSGGGGANWANGLYRWKVGGLTITFTIAEPLSEDADNNTWSLRAFLVVQTAGSSATVKASGYVDYEYTTIVDPTRSTIRIRPVVTGTLNTTTSNTTDLTFENQGNVLTEFVGSAAVLLKY